MTSLTKETRCNALPILYTRGTHYEVGHDMGRTFRGIIEDFLASFEDLNKVYLPLYDTKEGRSAYDLTLASLQKDFPHYVRELQGIADGAKVPFHHLLLLHMDQTMLILSKKIDTGGSYGCTSICTNYEGQVLLGHTEDATLADLNNIYLVSAHITEKEPQGKYGCKSESFTALCYAGHLPGFCMGYNQHGLIFSINALSPLIALAGKTPRHFLCRALLAADTMAEAQKILKDKGNGLANGFSVNLSFAKEKGDHLFHNIEVGPADGVDESQISVHTIHPGEHYFHANKYLHLNVPTKISLSSDHRHARAKDCPPPKTKETLLSLLSDSADPEYPFFREGKSPDKGITVTLGLFDLVEKTWMFWMKNPRSIDPLLKLNLEFSPSN